MLDAFAIIDYPYSALLGNGCFVGSIHLKNMTLTISAHRIVGLIKTFNSHTPMSVNYNSRLRMKHGYVFIAIEPLSDEPSFFKLILTIK